MRLNLEGFALLAFFLKLSCHVIELRFNVLLALRGINSFDTWSILDSRDHLSINLILLQHARQLVFHLPSLQLDLLYLVYDLDHFSFDQVSHPDTSLLGHRELLMHILHMKLFAFFKARDVTLDPDWKLFWYLVKAPIYHRLDIQTVKLNLSEL